MGRWREWLRGQVAEYMVPAEYVEVGGLPRLPSGKLDRRALPAPSSFQSEQQDLFVAPRTRTEKELAEIWAEVLQVERVGVDDNFFELGGHSLKATQLIARTRASFGVKLVVKDLFQAPTVTKMAEMIEEAILANSSAEKVTRMMALLEEAEAEESASESATDSKPNTQVSDQTSEPVS